ncbi:MAG TPA: lipopolysaccharide biosynthesis protein [Anaerolineales bacterium]|nr:lipopolysaccharide biosynthesis protein [Anaerolineales bacterium]
MLQERLSRWRGDLLLRRVIRNSSYLFSSSVLSAALSFAQTIIATRLVGVTGYGLVGVVMAWTSNVNNLLSFRMSEAVVKFYGDAVQQEDQKRAAAVIKGIALTEAGTSLLTFLVWLALVPFAAVYLGKDAQTAPLFAFYGVVILLNSGYETSRGILQTARRFDLLARITVIQSIITAGMILAAFLYRGNVAHILAAYLAGKAFAGAAIVILAGRALNAALYPRWWRARLDSVHNWREIGGFVLNTNLNGTVNLIARDSAPSVLAFLRPPEVALLEVGYFRIALTLINLATLPIEPLIWPTYAEITRTIAERKWRETKTLLRRVSLLSASWLAVSGSGLALLGWWLIPLLYRPAALPAYPAVLILLLGYGFAGIFTWNRPLLLALGKPGYPLMIAAIVGLIELALAFVFVPRFGYLAQAALLSSYFVVAIALITLRGLHEIRRREASEQ